MRKTYVPDKSNTHLKDLILGWRSKPEQYETELVLTLDKIIGSILFKYGKQGWNRSFEFDEDLIPTYRAFCIPLLHRVNEEASNKEIFAYIKRSILLYNKRRKVASIGKNLNENQVFLKGVEYIKSQRVSPENQILENVLDFNSQELNDVARLLIEGYNLKEISQKLEISLSSLKKRVEEIKTFYPEYINE